MSDLTKTVLPIAIGAIALAVIVVGLVGTDTAPPTDAERVETLAASIRCPFCSGESLAESTAGVADDYKAIIATRVAEGATDDEILDEFAASFGEAYILDGSRSPWSTFLWAIPAVVLIGGMVAIVGLRRGSVVDRGGA
ncbi:MAG: cytochrome c-type biogenesis protein CcmH [Acidimicrobiia bacterium]|nr:cytochrome c-type biogenesis protein CcmH [Acidimicrobiia bacterium]